MAAGHSAGSSLFRPIVNTGRLSPLVNNIHAFIKQAEEIVKFADDYLLKFPEIRHYLETILVMFFSPSAGAAPAPS
jgi:hypothetical protein